jgi:hypothetical protein
LKAVYKNICAAWQDVLSVPKVLVMVSAHCGRPFVDVRRLTANVARLQTICPNLYARKCFVDEVFGPDVMHFTSPLHFNWRGKFFVFESATPPNQLIQSSFQPFCSVNRHSSPRRLKDREHCLLRGSVVLNHSLTLIRVTLIVPAVETVTCSRFLPYCFQQSLFVDDLPFPLSFSEIGESHISDPQSARWLSTA